MGKVKKMRQNSHEDSKFKSKMKKTKKQRTAFKQLQKNLEEDQMI